MDTKTRFQTRVRLFQIPLESLSPPKKTRSFKAFSCFLKVVPFGHAFYRIRKFQKLESTRVCPYVFTQLSLQTPNWNLKNAWNILKPFHRQAPWDSHMEKNRFEGPPNLDYVFLILQRRVTSTFHVFTLPFPSLNFGWGNCFQCFLVITFLSVCFMSNCFLVLNLIRQLWPICVRMYEGCLFTVAWNPSKKLHMLALMR